MQSKEGDVFNPYEVTEMFRFIVDNMTTRDELQWVKDNMATREELQWVKDNMATKEELGWVKDNMTTKEELRKVEHRLMDHTTRECAKVRGDLVSMLRREDEKADAIISVVENAHLVSREGAEKIRALGPFPRLTQPIL